jgi:hypothetical protein
LLLQLIEQRVLDEKSGIQMVASTHSPQLLGRLSPRALNDASLTYRLEGEPKARIRRIVEIPGIRAVLEKQPTSRLHESGWLENAVAFAEANEAVL